MSRVRFREVEQPAHVVPRQPTRRFVALSKLLHSRQFQIDTKNEVAKKWLLGNLQSWGGEADPEAGIYVGDAPMADTPSVGLLDKGGILGPRSFGFLNNLQGIAPFAAPLSKRPRLGSVAVVVPRREALPEIIPLLCKHNLGISWVISVGDGDPAEVVQFLQADPSTQGVLLACGKGTKAISLQTALGPKKTAVLSFDDALPHTKEALLYQAVARRAGAVVAQSLEEWLAHGALFERASSTPTPRKHTACLVVVGAGLNWVTTEAKKVNLPKPLHVEQGDEVALQSAVKKAAQLAQAVIVCGDPAETSMLSALPGAAVLPVDGAELDQVRAVIKAAAARALPADDKPVLIKPDATLLANVVTSLPPPLYTTQGLQSEETLSDHDAKRLLYAYGVRVSRQAPAGTVTAVLRVVTKLGLPVTLWDPTLSVSALCTSVSEVKRHAPLFLNRYPYLLVQEKQPDGAVDSLHVVREKQIGPVLYSKTQAVLLPVRKEEAMQMATTLAPSQFHAVSLLADLITQISACAEKEQVRSLSVDICLAEAPVVIRAKATWQREKA